MRRGPARRRPGGRSVPQVRSGSPRGQVPPPAAAAAAEGRPPRLTFTDPVQTLPLHFVPVHGPGGAAPPSAPRKDPGPVTRRPRRSGGTGKTRLGPRERHRRHRGAAHFRFRSADRGRARGAEPGRAALGSLGTPGSRPASGRLGLQGVDQKGGYKKLGGGSWDVAGGLPRELSVHETKQGVSQIGSASVLPLLQPGLLHLSRAFGSGSALQYPLILRILYINHDKDVTKQVLYSLLKNKLKLFITQTFLVPDVKFIQLIYFHTALF